MGKYSISKLNNNGQPDGKGFTIEDTESRMFIQLAKEIVKGTKGFMIYQSANRSGLKSRYLIKNPDGKGFAVKNDKGQIIEKFTVSGPDFQEPKKPKAPKSSTTGTPRAAPKSAPKPTVPKAVPRRPAPYYYVIEHSNAPWIRSKESRRFSTVKEMYMSAYQTVNKDHGISCVLLKNEFDSIGNAGKIISFNPWYRCVTLGVYGKENHDYRLYADGRVKLLTKADIKRDY